MKKLLSATDKLVIAREKAREILARYACDSKLSQVTRDRAAYSAVLLRRDGD